MFHSFVIRKHDEELSVLAKDISLKNPNQFVLETEVENKFKSISELENTSIHGKMFLITNTINRTSISISAFSNDNGLLLDFITGLYQKYNVDIEYDFHCSKLEKSGKIHLNQNGNKSIIFQDVNEMHSEINETILHKDFINAIQDNRFSTDKISINKTHSNKTCDFGMECIEEYFEIIMDDKKHYFNVSLDRIFTKEGVDKNRIITVEHKDYFISNCIWSKTSDFKLEGTIRDMDSELIIKHIFDILSIKEAC